MTHPIIQAAVIPEQRKERKRSIWRAVSLMIAFGHACWYVAVFQFTNLNPNILKKCVSLLFFEIIEMFPASVEHELILDVIEDWRRLKDVRQLSPIGQTSSLESFHRVINHFVPKMYHFHFRAMHTRFTLHFNYNSKYRERSQKNIVVFTKHKKREAAIKIVPGMLIWFVWNKQASVMPNLWPYFMDS